MKTNYDQFSAIELAADPFFQDWVLRPSEHNQAFWSQFLLEHPGRDEVIQEAKDIITEIRSAFKEPASDLERLHRYFDDLSTQVVTAEVGATQNNSLSAKRPPSSHLRKVALYRWAVAASWLLVAAVAWSLWQSNQFVTYQTDYGEWKTVTLPDQSSVELNANSKIKVSRHWKKDGDRNVWLDGEAFFDVEKTPGPGRKFIVTTKDLSVEVLGTSFNVSTREEKTSVYLEEGRILLNMGQNVEHMEPGNYIAYSSRQDEIIDREDQINENKSTWHTGVLVMEEKAVQDIAEKLEEIYGVEVIIKDEQQAQRVVTVRLPLKQLDVVIPIMESVLGITIKITENNQLIFI